MYLFVIFLIKIFHIEFAFQFIHMSPSSSFYWMGQVQMYYLVGPIQLVLSFMGFILLRGPFSIFFCTESGNSLFTYTVGPTVLKLWARRMWLRTTCTIGFWYVVLLKYICPRVVTKLKIVSFWTSHTSFIISFLFDCIISCKQWWLRRKPGCLVR